MSKNALVLGQGGRVVGVVGWTRAVELAYFRGDGMAVVVLEYHNEEVRSPSTSLKLPSVMLLLGNRDRCPSQHKMPLTKRNVLLRDEGQCQWCGKHLSMSSMTIDHVYPTSKGGTNTWRNVVASCVRCNNEKGNMTGPEYEKASGKKLLNKPCVPGRDIMYNEMMKQEHYQPWKQYVKARK